jgi:hypothetical protein
MEGAALAALAGLVPGLWRDADPAQITAEKISHRRNADHWRVRHGAETLVVRSTTREASARRIIAGLTALRGEPFAPDLRASVRRDDGTFLIAMEDLGETVPTAGDTQAMLPEFVGTIRLLHNNAAFQQAVGAVGRGEGEHSSLGWAEEEWAVLQEMARADERLVPARRWLDIARDDAARASDAREIMVCGHGDLHNANWRRSPRGLVIIDWEEIRRWPLASELGDFIVFGELDPVEVTRLYGAPDAYAACVHREAASCALSFYLYWLRTTLDGSDPRAASFARVGMTCERLFSIP